MIFSLWKFILFGGTGSIKRTFPIAEDEDELSCRCFVGCCRSTILDEFGSWILNLGWIRILDLGWLPSWITLSHLCFIWRFEADNIFSPALMFFSSQKDFEKIRNRFYETKISSPFSFRPSCPNWPALPGKVSKPLVLRRINQLPPSLWIIICAIITTKIWT